MANDTRAAVVPANEQNGVNGHAVPNGNGNGHPNTLKKREPIDWEIPRKLLHSSIGFLTIYLYTSHGNPRNVVVALCTGLAVVVPVDLLRLRSPSFEKIYERCLGFLMRESEKKTVNGVVWYLVGVSAALTFYPLDVATVAVLILSWADTAASTFGRLYGPRTSRLPKYVPFLRIPFTNLRLKFAGRKSVAGFIAATISGAVIAVGFWAWIAPTRPQDLSWSFQKGVLLPGAGEAARRLGWENVKTGGWAGLAVIGGVAGLVSGVAEALDLGSLDDNLTLPIIAGGCLFLGLKLAGLFSA